MPDRDVQRLVLSLTRQIEWPQSSCGEVTEDGSVAKHGGEGAGASGDGRR
jgi:hypothetical protein